MFLHGVDINDRYFAGVRSIDVIKVKAKAKSENLKVSFVNYEVSTFRFSLFTSYFSKILPSK